jgi:hypothetical protein
LDTPDSSPPCTTAGSPTNARRLALAFAGAMPNSRQRRGKLQLTGFRALERLARSSR